ncbi:MAG: hypothetical protein GY814_19505 [Gammaproteobacteria bacterium]|nr:hypothetical protein [Gammaproteobacteria bacterium]
MTMVTALWHAPGICRCLHALYRYGCDRVVRGQLMKTQNLLLYHGFPLLVLIFPFLWVGLTDNRQVLDGEMGIIENATVVFLIASIGYYSSSMLLARQQDLSAYLKAC